MSMLYFLSSCATRAVLLAGLFALVLSRRVRTFHVAIRKSLWYVLLLILPHEECLDGGGSPSRWDESVLVGAPFLARSPAWGEQLASALAQEETPDKSTAH